jgi:hypothetical protein
MDWRRRENPGAGVRKAIIFSRLTFGFCKGKIKAEHDDFL